MLLLYETAAGLALFKTDDKHLKDVSKHPEKWSAPDSLSQKVTLAGFHKFKDSAEALAAAVAINEGSVEDSLKRLIKKTLKKEADDKLAVIDPKLGNSIKQNFAGLDIVSSSRVQEFIRLIRGQMDTLIPGITGKENSAMMLGLGHNLSRFKVKFSPDKIDTMVIQAVSLLNDLDKELNNYVMRAKEWYGWHFPELAKILTDNSSYIQTILKMGDRENAKRTDFEDVLTEELAAKVKEAAEVSMGCEVGDDDLRNMQNLCTEINNLTEYRSHLSKYLTERMMTLGPNLYRLLGENIAAKMVAHCGSLINLAKTPASTIQLIGAEKALFRALKTKSATPKYGIIYHAEMVSKTGNVKNKSKMARMLAAKAALAARVDALGEDADMNVADAYRAKLIRSAEYWGTEKQLKDNYRNKGKPAPYVPKAHAPTSGYSTQFDSNISVKRPAEDDEAEEQPKKKKRKTESTPSEEAEVKTETEAPEKKKKKKKDKGEKSLTAVVEEPVEAKEEVASPEKKKKKKKKSKSVDEE